MQQDVLKSCLLKLRILLWLNVRLEQIAASTFGYVEEDAADVWT